LRASGAVECEDDTDPHWLIHQAGRWMAAAKRRDSRASCFGAKARASTGKDAEETPYVDGAGGKERAAEAALVRKRKAIPSAFRELEARARFLVTYFLRSTTRESASGSLPS